MPPRPLPIVLAGGASSRFGADKLRHALDNATLLIDRPLAALREALGPPIALAGSPHPDVAARADFLIPDTAPGQGPIAGLLAALAHPLAIHGVFVLAGDLPAITADEIRAILAAADASPDAWAVLAASPRPEPCVGLYRQAARAALESHLATGRRSLHDALPIARVATVLTDPSRLRNVNTPADLPARP